MSPLRHAGHLPAHSAVRYLIGMVSTVAVPEVGNDTYRQVWCEKEVQNARIDPGRNTHISIADVVFEGGPAHRTLGFRRHGSNHEKEDKNRFFHV